MPGVRFSIHVTPGVRIPSVGGVHGEALIVRVRPRAVDGAANEAVISALAEAFKLPVRDVQLVRGLTSRSKIIEIVGDEAGLRARLGELTAKSRA